MLINPNTLLWSEGEFGRSGHSRVLTVTVGCRLVVDADEVSYSICRNQVIKPDVMCVMCFSSVFNRSNLQT